jgi:hypothetical protein
LASPKILAPLTTDPAAGADVVLDKVPAAVVGNGVPPVVVDGVLVLEHPAIATAITTNMIARILIRETFIISLRV